MEDTIHGSVHIGIEHEDLTEVSVRVLQHLHPVLLRTRQGLLVPVHYVRGVVFNRPEPDKALAGQTLARIGHRKFLEVRVEARRLFSNENALGNPVLEVTRCAGIHVIGLVIRFLALSQDDSNQVVRTLRQIAAPHGGADLVIGLRDDETDMAHGRSITVRLERIDFGQLTTMSVHAAMAACWRGRAYNTSPPATIST